MNPSIQLNNVSFCYVRAGRKIFSFKNKLKKKKEFWALRNISFKISDGEKVGIVGRNGSGKSSLARLCAGSLYPDKGEVTVTGTKQLLSLGVGFKAEMTGRENVYISASLLGLNRAEIDSIVPDVIDFSGLGSFFDEPVRTYSSGMKSKLGFAVSTTICPDILILDEVLATGDAAFREKAFSRLSKMVDNSGILIMVSHSAGQIRKMCDRTIWIDHSQMVMDGPSRLVGKCYKKFCEDESYWLKLGRYPTKLDL